MSKNKKTIDIADLIDKHVDINRTKSGRNNATRSDYLIAVQYILNAINIAYDAAVPIDKKKKTPKLQNSKNNKKSLIITLFDSHFGELIEYEDPYSDYSEILYDLSIAKDKINTLFNRAYTSMLEVGVDKFDEIVIAIGGDNIDGDGTVYPTQREFIEVMIYDQIFEFSFTIYNAIKDLLNKTNRKIPIKIVGVAGNHGKSKSNMNMGFVANNADTGTYKLLELLIHNDKDIKNVTIEYSTRTNFKGLDIKGHKYLLYHALPKSLLTPTSKAKVSSMRDLFDADVLLTGHFHETALVQHGDLTVIRTGCLPGPNDYSNELMIYSPNSSEQLVIIVSKDNKIEYFIPVRLGGNSGKN